ncbi:Uncharacterised protein [uncultured archaeon]|nr:Uncharacterised protein [uncultured archaeon]
MLKDIFLGPMKLFGRYTVRGYTPSMLKRLIETYGFKISKLNKNSWHGTSNIEVIAEKPCDEYARQDFVEITKRHLNSFLLDESESERRLLRVWMDLFNEQMNKTWAIKE